MDGFGHWPTLVVKPVHARYFINRGHGAYEMNFGALHDIPADGHVPNDRFYINSRGKPPKIENLDDWRLEVVGDAVKKPHAFTFNELIELDTQTIDYVMDCGTNGRGFFTALPSQGWPLPAGFPPWQWGAMGAAGWTGVPLENLLRAVEAEQDWQTSWISVRSLDAVKQGQGEVRPFEHALPTAEALERKALLVFQMNGQPLPVDHGYPLRFFVPGYGANTNVKWLGRLSITRQSSQKSSLTFYGRAWSAPSTIKTVDIQDRARNGERRLGAARLAGTIAQRLVAGNVREHASGPLVDAFLLGTAGCGSR